MQKSPLEDLSFFKFPEVTPEVVQGIVLLVFAVVLTIAVTLFIQRLVNQWHQGSLQRKRITGLARGPRVTPAQRELLRRLLEMTDYKKAHQLMQDAEAYEGSVARLVEEAGPEELADLAGLRHVFHLNVMNPAQQIVSTRQLLPDFPLRLVAKFRDERLDLYCGILERDERFLVLDLNVPEEIVQVLTAQPGCDLIFWRENEGETLFRVTVEPIPSAANLPVFRAPHAFRVEDAWQRSDFRLTVEMPLHYTYVGQEALRRLKGEPGEGPAAITGEGQLLDLSFGGAAFAAQAPLAPQGIVQLQFQVHDQPVRLMLEVLSNEPYGERQSLVRGKLRGMQSEGRAVLNTYLSREQIKRLREREAFHVRPGA
jgi:hypothetical protein